MKKGELSGSIHTCHPLNAHLYVLTQIICYFCGNCKLFFVMYLEIITLAQIYGNFVFGWHTCIPAFIFLPLCWLLTLSQIL